MTCENFFHSQENGKITSGDHWVGNRLATAMIYVNVTNLILVGITAYMVDYCTRQDLPSIQICNLIVLP